MNEYNRSRSRDSHNDIPDKYILSQSTQLKKFGIESNDSIEKLESAYRNRRCQSVDTTYTRNS